MLTLLTDETEARGRTLRTILTARLVPLMMLVFEDSFLLVDAGIGYEGEAEITTTTLGHVRWTGEDVPIGFLTDLLGAFTAEDLVTAGVWDSREAEVFSQKVDRAREEARERRERAELARLRAKYKEDT